MCAAPSSDHCVRSAECACAPLRRRCYGAGATVDLHRNLISVESADVMLARAEIAVSDSAVGDINGSAPAR